MKQHVMDYSSNISIVDLLKNSASQNDTAGVENVRLGRNVLPLIVNNMLEFDDNQGKRDIDLNNFDSKKKYKLKGSKRVLF